MKEPIKKNPKLHVRTGDPVKILSGKHKNEQGVVLRVFPKACRAIVEGMNMVTKHIKPSAGNPKGTIQKQEASMHLSNLMVLDPSTGQAARIGRKRNAAGKLQRYSKKTGNFIHNGQA
jgi:large subunit ribosomal protein L24